MSKLVSFAVLIASIIFIGLLFYKVVVGFFIPVFLAGVLAVIFRPVHDWILVRLKGRTHLAAFATTSLIVLALFVPIGVVTVMSAVQGWKILERNDPSTIMLRINKIRDSLGLQMPSYNEELRAATEMVNFTIVSVEKSGGVVTEQTESLLSNLEKLIDALKASVNTASGSAWDAQFAAIQEEISVLRSHAKDPHAAVESSVELKSKFMELDQSLLGGPMMSVARHVANPTRDDIDGAVGRMVDYVRPKLLSITGATGAFLVRFGFGSVIMLVAVFFFLYDGPAMVQGAMRLSPLDDHYELELLSEFAKISRAIVLATLLSALVQGVTAGIGYAFVGMDYLVLLTVLTAVFAMVPFVGPAIVWIPVCLYLALYEESYWAAGGLALWGMLAVGTVDNLVKAVVLHGQSQLHPLLALLSVLGGVQALGPIGIVVGPMVVALLQTLLSILQRELTHLEDYNFLGLQPPKTKGKKRKAEGDSEPSEACAAEVAAVETATLATEQQVESGRELAGKPVKPVGDSANDA